MKRIILLLVTVALSSIYVWGQSTPPAGMFYMQFTVAPSTSFKFKLQGHLKNTDVWVSTSPANYTHQTISDVWSDYQTVNAGPKLPTTVRIYGVIKAIDAGLMTTNENNELALIDVTKNPSLIALSCYSAGVRTLKMSPLRKVDK